jgi:hypothetical protein
LRRQKCSTQAGSFGQQCRVKLSGIQFVRSLEELEQCLFRSSSGSVRTAAAPKPSTVTASSTATIHSPLKALIYRLCIEEGLLKRSQIAPNTFSRLVRQYELLKPDPECSHKLRLAFAKAHANEMWQADTQI